MIVVLICCVNSKKLIFKAQKSLLEYVILIIILNNITSNNKLNNLNFKISTYILNKRYYPNLNLKKLYCVRSMRRILTSITCFLQRLFIGPRPLPSPFCVGVRCAPTKDAQLRSCAVRGGDPF